jgi:SAM-dependent methyltransferase
VTPKVFSVFEAQNAEELAARYDEWSAHYEEDMDDHGGPIEAAAVVARYVDRGARILDAGCGTGLPGKLLAERGYRHLEGLDLSAGMLREAGKKGCYEALHQQTLGETLTFPAGSFDAVLSVGVFARAHAPARSFEELIRITRPGGYIIFTLRPEFYVATDFKATMTALAESGKWSWVETTEPFDGRFQHFPGISLQVWVYRVG